MCSENCFPWHKGLFQVEMFASSSPTCSCQNPLPFKPSCAVWIEPYRFILPAITPLILQARTYQPSDLGGGLDLGPILSLIKPHLILLCEPAAPASLGDWEGMHAWIATGLVSSFPTHALLCSLANHSIWSVAQGSVRTPTLCLWFLDVHYSSITGKAVALLQLAVYVSEDKGKLSSCAAYGWILVIVHCWLLLLFICIWFFIKL